MVRQHRRTTQTDHESALRGDSTTVRAVTPSPLVGRTAQLETIDAALADLQNGRGAAIHLVGEPGIGKSALLGHALRQASDSCDVRVASADDSDQRRRFVCVTQLFPGVALDRRNDPIGAVLASIDERSDGAPLVLLADDVQWADGASLEVLAAIARRAEEMSVVVITTARTHPRAADMGRFEAAIDRHGRRITLEPLAGDDIAELVEVTLGAPPGPALVEFLATTSGNPFLTVELLRELDHDHALDVVDGSLRLTSGPSLPRGLGGRLAREAIAASGNDSLLVRAAAVISGGFMAEELAEIIDRPLVDVVIDLLNLTEAEVLRERHGRLAFRHDLIRQAIIDDTPSPVVRSLNRRAAAVLAASNAELARVASCLLVAADPSDPSDLTALIDLGYQLRVDSPFAAADVLQTAVAAMDRSDPRLVDVVVALGWTLADLGRLTEVVDLLDSHADLGDGRLDVRRLRGHTLNLRGELRAGLEPLPDDFDIGASFERIDGDALAVVAELAIFELLAGRVDRSASLIEWMETSGVAIEPDAELYLCEARAMLHGRDGSYEPGLECALRGLALTRTYPDRSTSRSRPAMMAATMLDAMGRGEEALHVIREAHREPGPRWNVPLLQFGAATTLYRRGEWDDALAEIAAALTSADEFGVRLGTAWPHAICSLIHAARGEPTLASEWLRRARRDVPGNSVGMEWLLYAAAIHAEGQGDQQRALDTLRPVVHACIAAGAPAMLINLSPDTARLAAALGDDRLLHTVSANLAVIANNTASPMAHAYNDWVGAWFTGDHTSAARAADSLQACGRHAEFARVTHDAAVLAARAGAVAEARRLATRAFAAYDSLRANHLHARLRAEMRTAGVAMRPRRVPQRPTTGWDALTTTERQVVELVGDGMANGQIADQLFVSRRTVESHLVRVYQKLGFARRADLVIAERQRRELQSGSRPTRHD